MKKTFAVLLALAASALCAYADIVLLGPIWIHPVWDDITQFGPPDMSQIQPQTYCGEIMLGITGDTYVLQVPDSECSPEAPKVAPKGKK